MTDRTSDYRVRAVHCDHGSEDDAVYEALKRATAPLDQAWARLKPAKSIAIKFNQDFDPELCGHDGVQARYRTWCPFLNSTCSGSR